MPTRCILHVDMDAFYASVEQRDNPALRGKPVVVGGGENRGVVAAASYEARKYGVRSAMPMAEAQRRCRDLVRIPLRMSHYKAVSQQIFEIFREFTPIVEGLSLDEAFLDVTTSLKLFGSGPHIAQLVKKLIRERTQLTASVGVAENKLVAKIASDLDKPDGLVVVTADACRATLDPLPVSVLPGIGPKTLARLQAIGIETVRHLREAADRDLEPVFGRYTQHTRNRAAGIDERPVHSSRRDKSISAEQTYERDLDDPQDMERELLYLAERCATRLQKAALVAGTVQIKIRTADFSTCTRQTSLQPASNGTDQVFLAANRLLRIWLRDNSGARLRLLGVAGTTLGPANQADLFAEGTEARAAPTDSLVSQVRDRFGAAALGRARTIKARHDREDELG
ncbi:MAG TPA: DNA polymerase IV [Woeseiaceae bacterium]|nr:DNA polymerase IV [Woeseiaceae bacterium]